MTSEMVVNAVLVGVGATLVMDLWALLRQRLFAVASLDYALVGRWLGHMGRGRFRHAAIGKAEPVRGERLLGWVCHYLIGVAFAAAMLCAAGSQWLCRPTLVPALAVGLLSVAAPLLLMQPAFGMGLAASRTPNPWRVRGRALATHLVFGVGLFLAGWLVALLDTRCAG